MSNNRMRVVRLKRCKSFTTIEDEINIDRFDAAVGRRPSTSKRGSSKHNTAKREYMGRRSLGVYGAGGALAKTKRKKSKTEFDRDIYDDMHDDEGYVASSSSTYRCIPSLERSQNSSNVFSLTDNLENTFVPPILPPMLYSAVGFTVGNLNDKLEKLAVHDRGNLHQEISQFLKKADREKAQVQITQRVTTCALFGETVRFIVGENNEKKYSFENILWLVLKAHFSSRMAGRDLIVGKNEWMAEDAKIAVARQKYTTVLDKIKKFKFELHEKDENQFDSLNRRLAFSPEYCGSLRSAYKTVSEVLEDFDALVELFPTQKALWNTVEYERGSEWITLENKTTAMRVWLNSLIDIEDKIRALGVLFEVESMPRGKSCWFRPLDEDNEVFSFEDVRSVFGSYVKKSLNLKGMKKVLERVEKLIEVTLAKIWILMQKAPMTYAAATKGVTLSMNETLKERYGDMAAWKFCSPVGKLLSLPPVSHLFFFLLAVPMQLVVHWLEIRSDSDPPENCMFDELTFDAMITDSRDCVEEAVRIKRNYVTMLQSMCSKCALPGYLYPMKYNEYVLDVFKKYIHYVNYWTNCDSVRADPVHLFLKLEKEWAAALVCARSVRSAMDSLCSTFCDIIESLIKSMLENFSIEQVEEMKTRWIDQDNDDSDDDSLPKHKNSGLSPHQSFMVSINHLIKEITERKLRVFSFLRTALNDVYDASGYKLRPEVRISKVLSEMTADFCLVDLVVPSDIVGDQGIDEPIQFDFLIFVDKVSADKGNVETCLLAISEGRKVEEGCILLLPDHTPSLRSQWKGRVVQTEIDEETRIRYEYLRNDMILLVSSGTIKTELEQKYSMLLHCLSPSCSSNIVISSRIKKLTEDSLLTHLTFDQQRLMMLLEKLGTNFVSQQLIDMFWVHRDVARVVSDSFMEDLGELMIDKALLLMENWMEYVKIKNPQRTAHLPMWATQAFTFLQFFTEPKWTNSEIMNEKQYQGFSKLLEQLKSSLMVSSDSVASTPVTPQHRMTRSTSSKNSNISSEFDKKSEKNNQMDRLKQLDEKREKIDRDAFQLGKVVVDEEKSKFSTGSVMPIRETRAPFNFVLLNEIASGSFGTVYRALDIDAHRVIAAKSLKIQRDTSRAIEAEINIFRQLSHENLVKYYGVEVVGNEVIIFMEFCSQGTLERICHGRMDLKLVRQYTNSLLRAVQYLHGQKIVHRDIKPANIFLDKSIVLKLGDFGCSSRLVSTSTMYGEIQQTAGTPQYMAPEIYSYGDKNEEGAYKGYGRSVDIWAIGCTVVQMMTGIVPWADKNQHQIAFVLCYRKQKPTYPAVAAERGFVQDFLDRCFEFEPEQRATAIELLQTTFANVNVNEEFHMISDYDSQSSRDYSTNNSFQIL